MFALGDVQQRARGKRHGVDGHAVVCAAPAHDGMPLSSAIISMRVRQLRPPASLSPGMRSMGTATSIWPSRLICSETVMAFHLSWPGKETCTRSAPPTPPPIAKGPASGHAGMTRSSDGSRTSTLRRSRTGRPGRRGSVKFDSHESSGKRADEHHTTVDMGHAAALVGVSFDTNFSLHHRPFRLRSVRVRHQQRLQSVSS